MSARWGQTVAIAVVAAGMVAVSALPAGAAQLDGTTRVGTFPKALGISPDGSTLYAAVDEGLAIVDLATFQLVETEPTDEPIALAVAPSGLVYFTTSTTDVQVYTPATGAVTAVATLPGDAGGLSVSPDGSTVWVLNEVLDSGDLSYVVTRIDTTTSPATATAVYTTDGELFGIGGAQNDRVYVGTDDSVFTVTATTATESSLVTGPVVGITPIGSQRLAIAAGDDDEPVGAVYTIDLSTTPATVGPVASTGPQPAPPAITPDAARLYVVTEDGVLTGYNATTLAVVDTLDLGDESIPSGVLLTSGSAGYIALAGSQSVARVTLGGVGLEEPAPASPLAATRPQLAATGADPAGAVATALLLAAIGAAAAIGARRARLR